MSDDTRQTERCVASVEDVPMPMVPVLTAIVSERWRQEDLKRAGKFDWWVCKGLKTGTDFAALRAELIQVAACCVAWCEAIDEEHEQ